MEAIYLEAMVRDKEELGKSHLLRKNGFVPCVVYGEGKETLSLKIERGRLLKFLHAHHGGENMIITLKISAAGQKKAQERSVLIKEFQQHPVRDEILHMDFNEISLTKRIEVKVPIRAHGEPVGVKQEGGTLEQILWELEIECLPTQIPEKLDMDVSAMKIGDTIYVKDLTLPADVELKQDAEATVFHCAAPHKEEIPAAEEVAAESQAAASAEPEVIKKEKKPAEEEEEAKGESKAK
ncbi:MAG: 50S ribosomal protein L25 [Candidatus Omnitrophota bacterium]